MNATHHNPSPILIFAYIICLVLHPSIAAHASTIIYSTPTATQYNNHQPQEVLGVFKVQKQCPAYTNLSTKSKSKAHIIVGKQHNVISIKSPYVKITVPETGTTVWMEKTCGKLFTLITPETNQKTLPENTYANYKSSNLDSDVLSMCGDWGDQPAKSQLKSLLKREEHQAFRVQLKQLIEQIPVITDATSTISTIADIWFSGNAFHNVFCGIPTPGPHTNLPIFIPRYTQLEDRHLSSGILNGICPNEQEETPGSGTANVQYSSDDGLIHVKCSTPYSQLNAEEIILYGTFGYLKHMEQKNDKDYCYLMINKAWHMLYIDNKKLTDIKPINRPTCEGKRSLTGCMCTGWRNSLPKLNQKK